jgi:SNF2 family DNA or RNA helicase
MILKARLDYSKPLGWVLATKGSALRSKRALKKYGGREAKDGVWKFPGVCLYAERLLEVYGSRIELTDQAQERLQGWGFPEKSLGDNPHPKWESLYPYQKEAVTYLVSSTLHGSLLALAPRKGKTICTIIASQIMGYQNVLVLAPLTLLPSWVENCSDWGDIIAQKVKGEPEAAKPSGWVVTTYETLVRRLLYFLTIKWDLVVLDESVKVKNRKALKTQALKKVCGKSKKVWELSGSPITKRVDDLFNQFRLFEPQKFPSYWRFAEFYCEVEETVWGKNVVESKDMDFKVEFRDLMFVKGYQEIPDLPNVIYETINLEMGEEQAKTYYQVQDAVIEELSLQGLDLPNRMAQLTRLQQAVSCPSNLGSEFPESSCKVDAVVDMLELEACEFPILVWVHWRATGEYLLKRVRDLQSYSAAYLSGSTQVGRREELLRGYKRGDLDVLILSLGVGKYGLTLANTKTVVYLDRTFFMDDYVQSMYRGRLIGQAHSPVIVTLRCPDTVDELIEDNLAGKSFNVAKVSSADLVALLRGLGRS